MIEITEYLILRCQEIFVLTTEPLAIRRGAASFSNEPEQIEIEETELTLAELNHLRCDPYPRAIAPASPMKLITPVKVEDVQTFSSESTWGN